MNKKFIFSIANNGHENEAWTKASSSSKRNAAQAWNAEYILHTDIKEYIPAPSKKSRGFYEKFEMFRQCDGDIFFTDSDVVISPNCPNPFDNLESNAFHAVWESQYLVKAQFYEELWPERAKMYDSMVDCSWPREPNTVCPHFFNSGVMYFPKRVRDFFIDRLDEVRNLISWLNSRTDEGFQDQEVFNFLIDYYSKRQLLSATKLPPNWNVQASLEWRKLRGAYPWERFRRYRYWRKQAYWTKDARLDAKAYCIHYTGASRGLLEPEYRKVFLPGWQDFLGRE